MKKDYETGIGIVVGALILGASCYIGLGQFAPIDPHPLRYSEMKLYGNQDYILENLESHDGLVSELQKKYDACEAKLPEKDRDKPPAVIQRCWSYGP